MTLESLQGKIFSWCRYTFGDKIALDTKIRALRVLEEAIELAQAEGVDEATAQAWVKHVYSRPVGEVYQEAGGLAICFLAWAGSRNVELSYLADIELRRIDNPQAIEKIRAKQAEKNAVGASS